MREPSIWCTRVWIETRAYEEISNWLIVRPPLRRHIRTCRVEARSGLAWRQDASGRAVAEDPWRLELTSRRLPPAARSVETDRLGAGGDIVGERGVSPAP